MLLFGNKWTQIKSDMGNNKVVYDAPQIEIIEVEVEKGFAASPDPEITNPDMGWG